MGFLVAFTRKIQLQNRDNDIQFQLGTISAKLQDLTSFASILSQDSVNLSDIAAIPASLFGDGFAYLQNAHNRALQMSDQMFNAAASSGMFGDASNQMVMEITRQKMYENARKEIQKELKIKLNEEEKHLQSRKTRLETEDAEIQQQLQGIDQRIAAGIKSSFGGYTLQG